MNSKLVACLALAGLPACGPPVAFGAGVPSSVQAAPPKPLAVAATPSRTRLVVAVVVDQLPTWAFERYLPLLDPNGALRRALASGAYFSHGRYDYAGTYTAPGHATLFTGVLPREHGIVANEVWDAGRAKVVPVIDDGEHAVLGVPGQFASPRALRSATVADALEQETGGKALTVALSFKDRAAVLPGGQHPDLALFYESKRGEFTTSSWYAAALPAFVAEYQRAHPFAATLSVWTPGDAHALAEFVGSDSATGEGDFLGLGTTFPHDPRLAREPLTAARATPFAAEYLFALARQSVLTLGLGQDDVPDLLMVSVSSTDYAGHVFGPESWEYADSLVKLDRTLTRFLNELPAGTRVLLTSDHGAAPLPERSLDRGHQAFRVPTKKVAVAVNEALSKRFKLGAPIVASYTEPFVYFSAAAKASPAYAELLAAAASEVGKVLGVAGVYSVRELLATPPKNELDALIRASVTPDAVADLFVVPSEYSVIDPAQPGGTGTSHGSPWNYDRFVPVLFWGEGVKAETSDTEIPVLRVAPTLAALLGVRAPGKAPLAPLPGAPETP